MESIAKTEFEKFVEITMDDICPEFYSLDMRDCSPEDIHQLVDIMRAGRCAQGLEVDLSFTNSGKDPELRKPEPLREAALSLLFQIIGEGYAPIRLTIDFSGNHIKSNIIRNMLASGHCPEGLRLNGIPAYLTPDEDNIIKAVSEYQAGEKLVMSGLKLKDDMLFKLLATVKSKTYPVVTTLFLDNNHFTERGAKVIADILCAVSSSDTFTIDLSFNQLGNEGIEHLTAAMLTGRCPVNMRLTLQNCGFNNFHVIAKVIASDLCPEGLYLDLSRNPVTDVDVEALAAALEASKQLVSVKLQYSGMSKQAERQLYLALKKNQLNYQLRQINYAEWQGNTSLEFVVEKFEEPTITTIEEFIPQEVLESISCPISHVIPRTAMTIGDKQVYEKDVIDYEINKIKQQSPQDLGETHYPSPVLGVTISHNPIPDVASQGIIDKYIQQCPKLLLDNHVYLSAYKIQECLQAIRDNDIEKVKALIVFDPRILYTSPQEAWFRFVNKSGAERFSGCTAYHLACEVASLDMLGVIFTYLNSCEMSGSMIPSSKDREDVANRMVDFFGRLVPALHQEKVKTCPGTSLLLIQFLYDKDWHPVTLNKLLTLAASCGELSVCANLFLLGADNHANDWYPPNNFQRYSEDCYWNYHLRRTVEQVALMNGFLDLVSSVIDMGNNNLVKDANGQTILHYLARHPHYESFIQRFKNIRDDFTVNLQDNRGNTALHVAVMSRRPRVVEYLLVSDADATLRNDRDQTPYDIAIELKAEDEMKTLAYYGVLITEDDVLSRRVRAWQSAYAMRELRVIEREKDDLQVEVAKLVEENDHLKVYIEDLKDSVFNIPMRACEKHLGKEKDNVKVGTLMRLFSSLSGNFQCEIIGLRGQMRDVANEFREIRSVAKDNIAFRTPLRFFQDRSRESYRQVEQIRIHEPEQVEGPNSNNDVDIDDFTPFKADQDEDRSEVNWDDLTPEKSPKNSM